MIRHFKWGVVLLVLFSAVAFAKGVKQNVVFPKGETGTVLSGTVLRGDRDTYILYAKKGQSMTVEIASTEDNAVFTIYTPSGGTLPNAGESDDATNWDSTLPSNGKYKIEVGGTKGNAEYSLTIQINN